MFSNQPNRKCIHLLALGLLVLVSSAVANAQGCKPGEKVEYKAQSWPEKWEVGTCVKELPGGKQVVVREKPSQFYPEGFERAYALDEVRPVQQAQEAPAKNEPPAQPNQPDTPKPNDAPNNERANAAGGPSMSQQDVLSFLKQRLGDGDPFMNPKREQVLGELRQEILKRGVDFKYNAIGDFANAIGKFGPSSNLTSALIKNYGPPTKQAWYLGVWNTSVTSEDYAWILAGNHGSITINANGTYVWKPGPRDPPASYIRGTWRKATAEEMGVSDQGGDGLVLLKGYVGNDWLVRQDHTATVPGDWIYIENVSYRSQRHAGKRA